MCGRFSQTKSIKEVTERFQVTLLEDLEDEPFANYNAAPSQDLFVIYNTDPKHLQKGRWGLIPHWAKDPAIGNKMINARGETIAEKPSFKKPFQKQRCLVIADGFYEWAKIKSGKVPVRIILKDEKLFAFAGLWDEWKSPTGEKVRSFTIVTTTANEKLKPIHERMPTIYPPEYEKVWLDPNTETQKLLSILKPYPDEEMDYYPVSDRLNSARYNDKSLIERVDLDLKTILTPPTKEEPGSLF